MGGTLVVFCENGIIENISIGKSDFSRNINSSVNTKYRIASISKTITAIAVMQLFEQNLLDLDDDISSILGYSVQNPNHPTIPITTRMLLSHTSSIIDGTTYSSFLGATVNNNPIPNLSEILTASGSFYTQGQFNNTIPGTYFNYSNINYVILGTIIEKVSNIRFDIYCKQNISIPLGIDASFNVNDLVDIDQLAVLYRKINSVWTPQSDNYQGIQPVFSNLNGYIPGTNGGRFGPQGGFRCSGQDLAKIFLVLMNNGNFNGDTLLSESSCIAMFANEWTFNGSNGNNYFGLFRSWGLGIHRITSTSGNDVALPGSISMLGHTGEAYGLVSDAYFDTIRKIGFVFINNGVGIGYQTNSNSIFYTVEQEVFNAIENYGSISNCLQTVALNESNTPMQNVYPNPASDFIYLSENLIQRDTKIFIRSIDGKLLKSTFMNKGHGKIDVQALQSGMYMLEADDKYFKFIKE
jgi:CubicO group peptidase (beta-lactamase class C family)